MPKWLIKSGLHRMISWLPYSHQWNRLFQSLFTHTIRVGLGSLQNRAGSCTKALDAYYTDSNRVREGLRVVEIGTGWFPVVPVAFYLCGAEKISTYDIVPLLSSRQVRETLELFISCHRAGELRKVLPRLLPERVNRLEAVLSGAGSQGPAQILAGLGIDVLVQDARRTGLADGAADIIFSIGVLQHIPATQLKTILSELARVAAPGAVMAHWINLSDLFSRVDPGMSKLNFLKFTDGQWRFLDSPITPQNRLRLSDYRRLTEESGFQILREEVEPLEESNLDRIHIAPQFRAYSREDLLAGGAFLVAEKRQPATGL